MKRARIMLIAIAVLATVGGALAFKASKKFADNYCVLTTQPGLRTTCSTWSINFKAVDAPPGTSFYYITTTSTLDCTKNIVCTTTKSLITNE